MAAVVTVGAAASAIHVYWRSLSPSAHGPLPPRPPDDDLPPLAQPRDTPFERAAAGDVFVAATEEFYVARAGERSIVAISKGGATPARTVARLEGPLEGMAVAGRMLLWTTAAASPSGKGHGTVMKVDPRGGHPSVVTGALSSPRAVVADGQWVFVVDTNDGAGLVPESTLVRVPIDGGEPATIAHCRGDIANVVIDAANVYFADGGEGTVLAVPKAGGSPRVVATHRGLPRQVVVDDHSVSWVEKESESLWTVPKGGGSVRRVAQDFAGFRALAADGASLWWINETAMNGSTHVLSVPEDGGDPRVVAEGSATDAIASDGARVYWEHDGRVAGL